MVEIKPFKGIYYNKEKIEKMEEVITPPYDIISPSAQNRYYKMHPYNIIRIVLGKKYPEDNENNNCYTRAKEYFEDLVAKEVLIQDKNPAFYIYQQEFSFNSHTFKRLGLICRVRVEEYEKRVILPHEATLKKPKEDRFNLIKSTGLNLCPVFGLYEDDGQIISKYLKKITYSEPMMSFKDEYQITHTLWKTELTMELEEIQGLFDDRRVLIADGHHRYEVAIQFKKYLQNNLKNPPQDINYTLFCLTAMNDSGLVILPIHRMIKNVPFISEDNFLEILSKNFDVEELNLGKINQEFASNIEKLLFEKGKIATIFGIFLKNSSKIFLAKLKNNQIKLENPLDSLDVSILHNQILKKIPGFSQENSEDNIKYTKDTLKVLEEVSSGLYDIGFILNPTKIEQVKEVAFSGQLMPQKSTYFYPKLISGLVINKII